MIYKELSLLYTQALNYQSQEQYIENIKSKNLNINIVVLTTIYDVANGNIRCIRKLTGLSQAKFCKEYDVGQKTLEFWETKKRIPPISRTKWLLYIVMSSINLI